MAEKDYAKIAASRIHRPGTSKRPPKFLIYGRNKKGKTTFGISGGVERTLVIDPEHGTSRMKVTNPHVWPVGNFSQIDDPISYLETANHPYEWVVIDGLTRISNMCLHHVMKVQEARSLDRIPGLVQQRDYGKSGELMKELLIRCHNLNMGVIYTAQERMQEQMDSEEDEDLQGEDNLMMWVPDLPKAVRGTVNSLADVIGRIYVAKVQPDDMEAKPKAERRLWIGESLKYDTGYRSDHVLPDMVRNPTIPKLVRLIETGSVKRPAA